MGTEAVWSAVWGQVKDCPVSFLCNKLPQTQRLNHSECMILQF